MNERRRIQENLIHWVKGLKEEEKEELAKKDRPKESNNTR